MLRRLRSAALVLALLVGPTVALTGSLTKPPQQVAGMAVLAGQTPYTPAWSTPGTQPSKGNGSLTGGYTDSGGLIAFWISLVAGSTTSPGMGTWTFTLPTSVAQPTYMDYLWQGQLVDAGGAQYPVYGFFNGPNKVLAAWGSPVTGVTGTSPFTFGLGDRMFLSGQYWSTWSPTVAAFVGDSYTIGVGASSPGKRFSTLISQARGWSEVNLAVGGTGYVPATPPIGLSYTERIPDVAATNPGYVIVTGGRNDLSLGATQAWADAVAAFFVSLRAAVPTATIIAASPIWGDGPVPANLATMRQVVRQAVTAAGGQYVDLGDPLLGHPEYMAADGVHPNDAGHAAIANAFIAACR